MNQIDLNNRNAVITGGHRESVEQLQSDYLTQVPQYLYGILMNPYLKKLLMLFPQRGMRALLQ